MKYVTPICAVFCVLTLQGSVASSEKTYEDALADMKQTTSSHWKNFFIDFAKSYTQHRGEQFLEIENLNEILSSLINRYIMRIVSEQDGIIHKEDVHVTTMPSESPQSVDIKPLLYLGIIWGRYETPTGQKKDSYYISPESPLLSLTPSRWNDALNSIKASYTKNFATIKEFLDANTDRLNSPSVSLTIKRACLTADVEISDYAIRFLVHPLYLKDIQTQIRRILCENMSTAVCENRLAVVRKRIEEYLSLTVQQAQAVKDLLSWVPQPNLRRSRFTDDETWSYDFHL